MYISHLKEITRRTCPTCSSTFCLACGERVTASRDQSGKLAVDENPLFHCANLQGVILGVGLLMLEQIYAEQIGEASATARRPNPSNSKKRKVSGPSTPAPDPEDEEYTFFVPPQSKGKKPKAAGIGYAGNVREDVGSPFRPVVRWLTVDFRIRGRSRLSPFKRNGT